MIKFDFSSDTDSDAYAKLEAQLAESSGPITVLYNNVGVSYDHAEFLEALPATKVDAIIEVNIRAMVKVSQLVLKGMLKEKRGAIINIGSAAGSCADPLYSVVNVCRCLRIISVA